jgi:N-acetylmuramoyl-L-alanine amidase
LKGGEEMKRICLDAGHGGHDPGAVSGSRLEKNDNLRFTLALGKLLQAKQIEVVYTRTTDVFIALAERANIANRANADFFISIHRNSAVNIAEGAEMWLDAPRGTQQELAGQLQRSCVAVGFRDRGIKINGQFTVLSRTTMQSVLAELGFINNPRDNALFDGQFETLTRKFLEEICSFFGACTLPGVNPVLGWRKEGDKWLFTDHYGPAINMWKSINDFWYYFNAQGHMLTGKHTINGKYFYFYEERDAHEGIMLRTVPYGNLDFIRG